MSEIQRDYPDTEGSVESLDIRQIAGFRTGELPDGTLRGKSMDYCHAKPQVGGVQMPPARLLNQAGVVVPSDGQSFR